MFVDEAELENFLMAVFNIGATTLSIMPLSIMPLSITALHTESRLVILGVIYD